MNLLSHEGKLINKIDISSAENSAKIVATSKEYSNESDLIFLMLSNGKLQCYSATTFKKKLVKSCSRLDE